MSDASHFTAAKVSFGRTLSFNPLDRVFFGKPEDWKQYFAREMPDLDVRIWPDAGNRDEIDVIACGWLPEGEFKTFPNLKLIVSLLAGPDHLLHDPAVPTNVPIV